MAYERVSYTTVQGKESAAYWDAKTLEAWDVFTREPVALLQDPTTHLFSEWVPKNAAETSMGQSVLPPMKRARATPVTIRPIITPLMIIPAGLFGLACIWLEITFAR